MWIVGLVTAAAAAAAAACGPKVDARSPFDEDDPRAGRLIDAGVPVDAPPADAPEVAKPREGTATRAAVDAVLDASPGALLKGIEVEALRPGGTFAGWQLVRVLRKDSPVAMVDVKPGDVLLGVNGHTLETPQDLSALWAELYRADAIEASLERGGEPFTIRYEITP